MRVTENLTCNTGSKGVVCVCGWLFYMQYLEGDCLRLGPLHKGVIKDLGSFLLLTPLSLVHGSPFLGGKTVSEHPGMAAGPQAGRRGWTKGKAQTSHQLFFIRKVKAPRKMHLVTSTNILLTRTMSIGLPNYREV